MAEPTARTGRRITYQIKSTAFVFNILIKSHQVKHFPHPGANPVSINRFQLRGGKIGRQMSQHAFGNKQVVTGQQDFGHYVTLVPKVLGGLFQSQVVKAIHLGNGHLAISVRLVPPISEWFVPVISVQTVPLSHRTG